MSFIDGAMACWFEFESFTSVPFTTRVARVLYYVVVVENYLPQKKKKIFTTRDQRAWWWLVLVSPLMMYSKFLLLPPPYTCFMRFLVISMVFHEP